MTTYRVNLEGEYKVIDDDGNFVKSGSVETHGLPDRTTEALFLLGERVLKIEQVGDWESMDITTVE